MEEFVGLIAEKGIIAGAFVYLLHMFLSKFSKSQELIAKTLAEVSEKLGDMDSRLSRLEDRKKDE